jgi:DNA-binding transcriptional LysR family regulator
MRLVDPVLLRTFVAVAERKSFTAAARELHLSQSTVSQHVARLERSLQRHLFARDTHAVALTPDGDALLPLAHDALHANRRIDAFLSGSELRGHLRFGASEDFALSALPDVLAEFADQHSSVDLELTVGLSGVLYEKYDAGELDLIFVKRRAGDERGRTAWEEEVVWMGRPGIRPDPAAPLPLVLFPPPSITRALAIDALERAGRSWRVACTSGSLSGLRAAALAGLGLAPHSARLIPPGLVPLAASRHLPKLGRIEFVVVGPGRPDQAAQALGDMILGNAGRIRLGRFGEAG